MKTQSEYYKYTLDDKLREKAQKDSARFEKDETQFQLGHLPTEQSHSYTNNFSSNIVVSNGHKCSTGFGPYNIFCK